MVVSPIHVEDMVVTVRDWLLRTPLLGRQSIYFVFTTGKTPGCAAETARRIARKKDLRYRGSAWIEMPTNYPPLFAVPDEETSARKIQDALPAVYACGERIGAGERLEDGGRGRWSGAAAALSIALVRAAFLRLYVRPERFLATERCISCGRCEKVCPGNCITMNHGRPVWHGRCIHCMACVSRCPTEAIEYGKSTVGKRRYHFRSPEGE